MFETDKPKFVGKEIAFRGGRLAFADIHTATVRKGRDGKPRPGAKAKFRGSVLLDPTNKAHAATIAEIKAESVRALNFRYGEGKFTVEMLERHEDGTRSFPGFFLPWGYGNNNPKRGQKVYDGYKDMFFLNMADETRPNLAAWRNGQKVPVVQGEPDCPYGGCVIAGVTTLYSYDNESKGVGANLRTLVYHGKGQAFGGAARDADHDFAAIGDLGGSVGAADPFDGAVREAAAASADPFAI